MVHAFEQVEHIAVGDGSALLQALQFLGSVFVVKITLGCNDVLSVLVFEKLSAKIERRNTTFWISNGTGSVV